LVFPKWLDRGRRHHSYHDRLSDGIEHLKRISFFATRLSAWVVVNHRGNIALSQAVLRNVPRQRNLLVQLEMYDLPLLSGTGTWP
jgi:hypothetical protein